MIERLDIEGFGANKKLTLEFSESVTTIIGKSYEGKSWALRALKWVMRNEPAGTSYINWDSDKAKVRLAVDGKKVVRVRGKTINTYRLSGEKEAYVAFGNNVPDDIAKLMNVGDLNFRGVHKLGQHEPPFWFCETAGEVSRQLNSIIDLEIIDKTLSNIDSQKRKTSIKVGVIESDLEKAVQKKNDLLYVKCINKELMHLEKLEKTTTETAQKRLLLAESITQVELYRQNKENGSNQCIDASLPIQIGLNHKKIEKQVESLNNLIESAEIHVKRLKNKHPSIKPLTVLKEGYEKISQDVSRLDGLIISAEQKVKNISQIQSDVKDIQKELTKVIKGRCPVCGKKLTKTL